MSFRMAAQIALAAGVDMVTINPGSVPFRRVLGPVLRIFADGGDPDPADPTRRRAARAH